jgi:transposase InsO family protein
MRSNLRWRSDGFEFTCWTGDVVRGAFLIDAHDREIIAWRAMANAGVSGSDIRDMRLEAVEHRFDACRVPSSSEMLSDNGSPYVAKQTRIFARPLGLKPCFTPIQSPRSNGVSEAFVKTLKRDYVQVTPLPEAETVLGWIASRIEVITRTTRTQGSECARPANSSQLKPQPPECPAKRGQDH